MSARGSPRIFRSIRYFAGSSAATGLTFTATGLYFFLVAMPGALTAPVEKLIQSGGGDVRGVCVGV